MDILLLLQSDGASLLSLQVPIPIQEAAVKVYPSFHCSARKRQPYTLTVYYDEYY